MTNVTYFTISPTHACFKTPTAVWVTYISHNGESKAMMASLSVWIVPGTGQEG